MPSPLLTIWIIRNPVSENQFDDGGSVFNDRVVNPESPGDQLAPKVAMDENGNFVVVWEDDRTINGDGDGQQFKPSVAMTANAGFVVTWEDDLDTDGSYDILARGLEF